MQSSLHGRYAYAWPLVLTVCEAECCYPYWFAMIGIIGCLSVRFRRYSDL